MKKSSIILSVLLIASVAINIRLGMLVSKSSDDLIVSWFDSMKIEDEALLNLEKGRTEQAKQILSKSVGEKALAVVLCIETKCASDGVLKKITK